MRNRRESADNAFIRQEHFCEQCACVKPSVWLNEVKNRHVIAEKRRAW